MNKVIKLNMLFDEGNVPDFGSIETDCCNKNIYYLRECDIPKLNTMLTKNSAQSYLPQNQHLDIDTGAVAFVADSNKIYIYHGTQDSWYEFNIHTDSVFNSMLDRLAQNSMLTTEITGVPPISFTGIKTGTLKNYRIYGNTQTVDGEPKSVGDKTANLFDKNGDHKQDEMFWTPNGELTRSSSYYGSPMIAVTPGTVINRSYTGTSSNYFFSDDLSQKTGINRTGNQNDGVALTVPDGCTKYAFNIPNSISDDTLYVVESSAPPQNYEPYGYRIPITINQQTFNIYLDSPLQKSGNTADYIDYHTQKRYNADSTQENIILPSITITTGMNTLSAGTSVQPSKIDIKGSINIT